jgi:hypothetical protein
LKTTFLRQPHSASAVNGAENKAISTCFAFVVASAIGEPRERHPQNCYVPKDEAAGLAT